MKARTVNIPSPCRSANLLYILLHLAAKFPGDQPVGQIHHIFRPRLQPEANNRERGEKFNLALNQIEKSFSRLKWENNKISFVIQRLRSNTDTFGVFPSIENGKNSSTTIKLSNGKYPKFRIEIKKTKRELLFRNVQFSLQIIICLTLH